MNLSCAWQGFWGSGLATAIVGAAIGYVVTRKGTRDEERKQREEGRGL